MKSGKFVKFNRSVLNAALASVLTLAGTGLVSSAYAAGATANSTATVITPIAIAKNVDLVFGKFAASPTAAGTILVSTAGARTLTTVYGTTDATVSAAKFTVTGEGAYIYSIAHTGSAKLVRTGGIPAAALDEMDLTKSYELAASGVATGTSTSTQIAGTLASGSQLIYVGGTLAVKAGQTAGDYTGNAIVTVEYN